jgi:hypothetical protein
MLTLLERYASYLKMCTGNENKVSASVCIERKNKNVPLVVLLILRPTQSLDYSRLDHLVK